MKTFTNDLVCKFTKKSIFSAVLLFIALAFSSSNLCAQTKWYYNGSGALNSTSSWGTSTNGTGGTLSNFTSGGRIFVIQNTTSVSLSGTWTIGNGLAGSAGGDSVILGNPATAAAPITLTLLSGSALSLTTGTTGNISVAAPSTGNHKIIYQNATVISFGTINDSNLELVFDACTISSNSTRTFGNVSVINGANVTMTGAATTIKNLTVDASSTLTGPTGASSNFIAIKSGSTVTINGIFRAGRQGGLLTAGVTLPVTPTASFGTLLFQDATPNITLGSASTIDFNRGLTSAQSGTQTVNALAYANLILSNPATFASNRTFASGTISVSGTMTVSLITGATITQPTNTFNFNGSGAQTIPSQLTSFATLGISGGTKTMSGNISVTSSLNLTSGVITTGSNVLTVTSTGTVSRTSGWVNGNLNRNIGTGASVSRVFHIGDATNYTPLTLLFANVTTQGNLTASTGTPISSVANYGSSPLSTIAYVNRFWSLSSASAPVFTGTYDATLVYVSGDLVGGATTSSLLGARYAASSWTSSTTTTATNTNTISGIATIADNFILANCANPLTPSVSIGSTTVSFCTGTSATFTATPTNGGSSPSYQWKNNGNNIGTNSPTLVLTSSNVANADVITCVMTANNTCQTTATATSNSLTLAVGTTVTPSVSISTATSTVCSGNSVMFTANGINGGTSPIYQWKKNGNNVATGSSITFPANSLSNSDVISCELTANNPCQTSATATSNDITMTVNQSPASASILSRFNTNTSSFTMCTVGSQESLYPSINNGVWSSSNTAVLTVVNGGSTTSSGLVTALSNGIATITYTLTAATSSCTTATSIAARVAQQATPDAVSGASIMCVGNTTTFSTTSTGGVFNTLGRLNINATSGAATATSAGSTAVKYTITNAYGCSASSSLNVTINALPATPTIGIVPGTPGITGSGGYCKNKTFSVFGTPAGGSWSSTGAFAITNLGVVTTAATPGAGSVSYAVTNANGCTSSRTIPANVVTCSSKGISNQIAVNNEQLVVYPNPAHSTINLTVKTLVGTGSIVITDLYGKQLKTQTLSMGTNTIDVSNFAKGMYLVSIITEQGKQVQKIIVE